MKHRAWLQSADEAKKVEQTQFRLLVDNVSLPVSQHTGDTHEAIIEAWSKAMLALDSLIKGAPQQIDNGAVLLGLRSWHLYPDILLADTNKLVIQGDTLINPGGVITIGLRSRGDDGRGVFWSLPLSHARYYGAPVMATRHAGVKESQVSFDEFMFVVLGSVMSRWSLDDLALDDGIGLIRTIARAACSKDGTYEDDRRFDFDSTQQTTSWLYTLETAAAQFERSKGVTRQHMTRLISFGQRRCSRLLTRESRNDVAGGWEMYNVFDLTSFPTLLRRFQKDGSWDVDRRLSLLRAWATRELDSEVTARAIIRYRKFEFAAVTYTVVQTSQTRYKRQKTGMTEHAKSTEAAQMPLHWMDKPFELQGDFIPEKLQHEDVVWIPPRPGLEPEQYFFLCGDVSSAAIYLPLDSNPRIKAKRNKMTIPQLMRCISEGDISEDDIRTAFYFTTQRQMGNPYLMSLSAISAAQKVYAQLTGARVDLQVTNQPLCETMWWAELRSRKCRPLHAIFSCIAYFETGTCDVDPEDMYDHIFAVCHANSIFVTSHLLNDPLEPVGDMAIERITGNVGKPGLAFLTRPPNPMTRKLDYSSWRMVNHEPFDGKAEDNFQGTSLHLHFTGYELPLALGVGGGRDFPACFLEAAVRVYDRGEWVADLDVLNALKTWKTVPRKPCEHLTGIVEAKDASAIPSLVSIDSWLELLDPPIQNAIVRANGNSVARLAAAALAIRQFPKVIVLSSHLCWTCQRAEIETEMKAEVEIESDSDSENNDGEVNLEMVDARYSEGFRFDDGEEVYAFHMSTEEDNVNKELKKTGVCLIY
jgi:hypothetical protein